MMPASSQIATNISKEPNKFILRFDIKDRQLAKIKCVFE